MSRLSGQLKEYTYNPGSMDDQSFKATDLTFPGAKLGDFVWVSVDIDNQDASVSANVTSENNVALLFVNNTGGAIDFGTMTVRIKVIPFDHI